EMTGEGVPLSISNKRETIDFEATKTWKNGKTSDYKEVKLTLYVRKKGEAIDKAQPVTGTYTPDVTESNGIYTYKWKKQLPKYDVDGTTELVYSVREVDEKTELPLKEGDKVKVGDNSYVVSYDGDNKVTNTYEVPKTKVVAKKIWQGGKENVRPTLYFKLYREVASDTQPWEVEGQSLKEIPKTDGTVEWDNLPATDEKGVKYTYSVMETDDQGNRIDDTVDGYTPEETDALTITNKYQAKKAKVDLSVSKELINETDLDDSVSMELQGGEFEFTLTDQNGVVKDTTKNDKDGNVDFKELTFDKEGTYTYTIKEVKGGTTENGIHYDDYTATVTVSVVDDGKGALKATAIYDGPTSFYNSYQALPAKANIEVGKDLLGGRPTALQADEFEFILKDEAGKELQRAKNDENGRVVFKDVPFTKEGIYNYTVVEANAGQTIDGVTYDARKVKVTVYVGDDGKGQLNATPTYDRISAVIVPFANFTTPSVGGGLALPPGAISVTTDGGIQRFENTYKAEKAKASLEVTKKLTGRELKADEFEFT
ncbi:Spy0128 family protein, partial [Streptococcus oralis]|uniref:Spy0128 family protein n=1 Tax=Streptococcus oralis TaxID=1303 RepID=UPI001009F8D4